MGGAINGIAQRVGRLRDLMENYENALTDEQRLELLNELYDYSLMRAASCAIEGNAKFSSTAVALMNAAREEIVVLQSKSDGTFGAIDIAFDPLIKMTGGESDAPEAEA